jgi:hypothetical protein
MKTYVHLWQYIAELFLECGMFQTNVVEKIKINILRSITLFRKSCCLRDNVKIAVKARQVRDDDDNNRTGRMRTACWITKVTDTHAEHKILTVFHGNSGYTKQSQSPVIRTSPGLLQHTREYLKSIRKCLWFVFKQFITYTIWSGLLPTFTPY